MLYNWFLFFYESLYSLEMHFALGKTQSVFEIKNGCTYFLLETNCTVILRFGRQFKKGLSSEC